eukprot:gnl/MRDRNA2_/MRDRNA2_226677_c0_seq1.p1 gnl/MRDRNA2_/MRDRNA2_226677_c0~~gnl/MRDRNA2_/MRDRNA2_226677_c0_seq1.p1  ORF type:complete len:296 (-),score=51.39 gnl/MRDRNA2_/MRDRNA2_226677_c0_seq1:56-835(-)
MTSILYSRVCLYSKHFPSICTHSRDQNQDFVVATTQRVADEWQLLSLVPASFGSSFSSDQSISNAQRQQQMFEESAVNELHRQVALLSLLLDPNARHSGEPWLTYQAALGPIVLDLVEILKEVHPCAPRAFVAEGPLVVHVAVERVAFCFATRECFFARYDLEKPQRALEGSIDDMNKSYDIAGSTGFQPAAETRCHYELCFAKEMEIRLLQHLGWDVVTIPFFTWRKLSKAGKHQFLVDLNFCWEHQTETPMAGSKAM